MSEQSNPPRVALPSSSRSVVPGARAVRPTDPNQLIKVTVRLKPRLSQEALDAAVQKLSELPPSERQYLSRQELEHQYGADPADVAAVEQFAQQNGLRVVEADAGRRSVVLEGTAQTLSAAFDVKLMEYEYPGGSYRGRVGPVHVPTTLAPIVEGVFGLDDRRQARPHFVVAEDTPGEEAAKAHHHASAQAYTPPQVAQLYDFPAGTDGSGQCVGILEFGGGFTQSDLSAYFKQLGVPEPHVVAVSVDGVQNAPGDPNVDGEVMLDIEVVGAIAPAAKIVVYFSNFTEQGWVDALTTAVHDSTHNPSVISISWGYPEGQDIWTTQAVNAVNAALEEAALVGVTVCAASGDDGSNDQVGDGHAHVDFPASSPYILGCGGTSITTSGEAITRETVWNNGPRTQPGGGAGGGGISDVFGVPAWQSGIVPPSVNPGHRAGRGVPDVAGDADETTGYIIRVHGKTIQGIGGTSAVAPLWSALLARINQHLGKPVGYLNPLLYTQLKGGGAFHDVTTGNNDTTGMIGGYAAGPGWDACTGWGSPDGAKLLAALQALPAAAQPAAVSAPATGGTTGQGGTMQ